ncbi:MAG: hypothetical protein SNJ79_03145 [Sphingomonadaceae bacterium]
MSDLFDRLARKAVAAARPAPPLADSEEEAQASAALPAAPAPSGLPPAPEAVPARPLPASDMQARARPAEPAPVQPAPPRPPGEAAQRPPAMPPTPSQGEAATLPLASPEARPLLPRADRLADRVAGRPARAPVPPAALSEEHGQAVHARRDLPPDREGRGTAGADAADASPRFAPAVGPDLPDRRDERQASLPPRADRLRVGPSDPPAHSVSIGRIEIVVAEPPAAPAGPERTRGFDGYARLRRGMER